jgi:isopenicillin N synthase-like dioxygenase
MFFAQPSEIKSSVPYDPKTNTGYIYKNIIEYVFLLCCSAPSLPTDMKLSANNANLCLVSRPNGKVGDPRESFNINKWPSSSHTAAAKLPPGLDFAREQIESFQKDILSFGEQLLELIALALQLPADLFTSSHNSSRDNFDNFLLMHYPPITSAELEEDVKYRISPHTDWGTVTFLFQQKIGGLQVRPPVYTSAALDLDSEVWTSAPVYDDMILVNIGDMLEFWTAGRLKSTWHRVVPNTAAGNLGGVDRYSFAYFLHPDRDTKLTPFDNMKREGWVPRYKGLGITAEEHVFNRINQGTYLVAENKV